jgi:hypothetical protein
MNSFTKSEKKVAKEIFELAKQRDYEKLKNDINSFQLNSPENIWELRDFLNDKAKAFDSKYDYRYSVLEEVFSYFIIDGLLSIDEIQDLSQKHKERIISLVNNIRTFNKEQQ